MLPTPLSDVLALKTHGSALPAVKKRTGGHPTPIHGLYWSGKSQKLAIGLTMSRNRLEPEDVALKQDYRMLRRGWLGR